MRSCSSAALLRRGDRDELDLGELVLADHAARVLAGGAGLGAEARRAGGEPHAAAASSSRIDSRTRLVSGTSAVGISPSRPLFISSEETWLANPIAADGPELIILELRQLRRAEHHLVAHQDRRAHLGVAVLGRVQVEHELGERALEPREAASSAPRSARPTAWPRSRNPSGRALRRGRNAAWARTRSRASRRTCGARHCRARPCRPAPRRAAGWGSARARGRAPPGDLLLLPSPDPGSWS